MVRLFWFLITATGTVSGILTVDSHVAECDVNIFNLSTSYFLDKRGNSVTSATIQTFKTVTKALLYYKVRMASDKNDKDYRIEAINTVIDVGKFLKGAQSNLLLKPVIDGIAQSFHLKITFPVPPASAIKLICNESLIMIFRNINNSTGNVSSRQCQLRSNRLAV